MDRHWINAALDNFKEAVEQKEWEQALAVIDDVADWCKIIGNYTMAVEMSHYLLANKMKYG